MSNKFCVSIFDGEHYQGEWFNTIFEAIDYFQAAAAEGESWKDIQLQRWTDDELRDVVDQVAREPCKK